MTSPGQTGFEALRTSKVRHRGYCARCEKPGACVGNVRVGLNEILPGRKNPKAVTTQSAGFCEPCAIEVYEVLAERLLVEAKRR